MDKSAIFHNYNLLKGHVDKQRLNRALGIAMSNKPDKYYTTQNSCTCPDCERRGMVCKHRIAKMLTNQFSIGDWVAPLLFPELAGKIEAIDGTTVKVNGVNYLQHEVTWCTMGIVR